MRFLRLLESLLRMLHCLARQLVRGQVIFFSVMGSGGTVGMRG